MARHIFNFEGGDELTTMGAVWFVSYSFYCHIDKSHLNWKKMSTYKKRASVFRRTERFHTFWLKQILSMNELNLNKNKIALNGTEVKEMAKKILTEKL